MERYHINYMALGFLGLVLLLIWVAPAIAQTEKSSVARQDIRILIDVSGSMKHNDPANLRRPALRLLTQLLPTNSQAGVWTFGRWVNMLVPHGPVNARWKSNARRAANEINSFGLFTNIEETLQSASWDWKEPDPQQQRSIILLTDGLVDIAKNASKNEASRQQILNHILPRLQQANVKIYTIALSKDADRSLLEQLSAATAGWHETVTSAAELERVFFRMFEKATQPETLPIIDNAIQVDSSINEATFLVFRKAGAPSSKIITPDNQEFSQDNLPGNVSWHHESNYDLITVTKPSAGTWHINADIDPDNRVMIVTDLTLQSSTLPSTLLRGDKVSMDISLNEHGNTITKKEFMHFINISLQQNFENDEPQQWHLLDNGLRNDKKANDGIYNHQLPTQLKSGRHEFLLQADGITFKRERRQFIHVHEHALMTTIRKNAENNYELNATVIAGLIEPDSLEITATIDPGSHQQTIKLNQISTGHWQASLADFNARHQLVVAYQGKHPDGRLITAEIGPLSFDSSTETISNVIEETKLPLATTQTEPNATVTHQAADPTHRTSMGAEQDNIPNWAFVASQVILFNLLAGGGIVIVYRKWMKKRQDDPNPLEELDHV